MGTILSIKKVGIALGLLAVLAGCSHTGGPEGDKAKKPSSSKTESGESTAGKRGQMVALTNAKTMAKNFEEEFEIEVKNVTLDFFEEGAVIGSDPKGDGNQLVRVELTVTNKGKKTATVQITSYGLITSAEKEGEDYYIFMNEDKVKDVLVPKGMDNKELKEGESASGALYFEAPATDTLESFTLVYEGYDGDKKMYKIPFKK